MTKQQLDKIVKSVLDTLAEWYTLEYNEWYDGRSSMILEIIHGQGASFTNDQFDYIFEKAMKGYE